MCYKSPFYRRTSGTKSSSSFATSIMARCAILTVLGLLICGVRSPRALGQSASIPSTARTQQAPLNILYRHFLAYQNHLDLLAASLDKQGKNGSDFRNHFQRTLGFSDAEFAAIRSSALRLDSKLREQDAKAKALIDSIHSQHSRNLSSPSDLPPFPSELVQMQKNRNAIIDQEVAGLKASLGPKQSAKLDSFIQNEFARNVNIQNIGPPTLHDAAHNPPPPFKPEVKP